ncbi:MAG: hypothetical protein Tsb009_28890 [Planctomycetaceae bacterium]
MSVRRYVLLVVFVFLAAGLFCCQVSWADEFTIRTSDRKTITLQARLAGSAQGTLALELPDGQIQLVAQGNVTKRTPGEDPKPITHEQMADRLKQEFGGEKLFRSYIQKPFVIGLVLSSPLKKKEELRCKSFLKKAGRFMRNVERTFISYARRMKFHHHDPRFPLVLLIFETDKDFEAYARKITGGRTLSANRIAGFYNGLTNWLAIRLSECHDYEVPLHEAIHQQVYNRGVVQRLSPAPSWFHEGIATGFAGNGDRISIMPNKVSKRFARRAMSATRIDWTTIVATDRPFRGNNLAADAYTHAWGLHWLLSTRFTKEYMKYVQKLSTGKTLETQTPEERIREFREMIGSTPAELQSKFPRYLAGAIKKQRISLANETPPGVSHTQDNLANVAIKAVNTNGVLRVNGQMSNISPIRAMTFYITVETNGGTYADWLIPSLRSGKTVVLQPQAARKVMRNARGGISSTFRVRVRAASPDSPEAKRWQKGELPVPVFGG